MLSLIGIFAYLGPETMLPMTSAIAGAIGVVMLVGRGSLRWILQKTRSVGSLLKPTSKVRGPSRRIGQGPVGPTPARARDRIRS